MPDQAEERPQPLGESASRPDAGGEAPAPSREGAGLRDAPHPLPAARRAPETANSVPRFNQEAVPLPPLESDPLAEAARHFRERQAQSAGIAELPKRTRALSAGDGERDLPRDGDPLAGLARPIAASPVLSLAEAASASSTAAASPSADAGSAEGPKDAMARASALAAAAPLLTTADLPAAPGMPPATGAATGAAEALPAIDRERRLPAAPPSNLRLFAGLSAIIAAFAGALVWIAMWRADSFSGGAEATIEISPEDLVQTAAGGNASPASTDSGGTVTATLLVRDTELLLAKLDFDPGPADGVLDDATRQAIRSYQQVAGLPQTGEPSKELLGELREVAAAIGTR